ETHRGEGAEAVGHPEEDGDPGPRHPEVRGPHALDRGVPRGDDPGPEGPGRRGRLDAVLHHDSAESALRRLRPMAVPSPQGRRLRQDRQTPGDLVPQGPGPDQGLGTGIVTSVPSDAPDDFVALRDLQRDDALLAKYHLDAERIRAIKPVPIIRTPGWGPLPGVEIVERLGIRDQADREKLEAAKAEVYKTGFYRGVLNENCGPYAGMRVEVAKEEIRKELASKGQADGMYEPSGEVVCRCTTRAIVKVVDNQWFLAYGDPAWKAKVHEAIASM